MQFAIKVHVRDPRAPTFVFKAQKTMYGGKRVAVGDFIFIFDSENEGGVGLFARGVVTHAAPTPRTPGVARQTPRVSVSIKRTGLSKQALGRSTLKAFSNWKDRRPQTELNFKLYRQATNKIVGLSDSTAAFLAGLF